MSILLPLKIVFNFYKPFLFSIQQTNFFREMLNNVGSKYKSSYLAGLEYTYNIVEYVSNWNSIQSTIQRGQQVGNF